LPSNDARAALRYPSPTTFKRAAIVSTGLLLSLAINLLVGAYFVWFYPRSVHRQFSGRQVPPAFSILLRILPPAGALLMLASVLYAILALAGAFGS
jgi:cellobiose-specific phosphotransferase system component IIC